MKEHSLLFILFFAFGGLSFAQVPQGIPYQAVARNSSGQPMDNRSVKVRFSVIDSIALGTAVYVESHSIVTNSLGLFSVNVGMGTPVAGTFSGINWAINSKFLKVELDTTASGNSFVDLGTQQMMSVPYALWSGSSSRADQLTSSCPSSILIPDGICQAVVVKSANINGVTYTVPAGKNFYLNDLFYRRKGTNPPIYTRIFVNGVLIYENADGTAKCGLSVANQLVFPPGTQITATVVSSVGWVCFTNVSENNTATISGFLVDKKVDALFLTSNYIVPPGKYFVQTNLPVNYPAFFDSGTTVTATPSGYVSGYLLNK